MRKKAIPLMGSFVFGNEVGIDGIREVLFVPIIPAFISEKDLFSREKIKAPISMSYSVIGSDLTSSAPSIFR